MGKGLLCQVVLGDAGAEGGGVVVAGKRMQIVWEDMKLVEVRYVGISGREGL
jgi:hypothetical protein